MKESFKKTLSMALAVCMVLALMPMAIFADDLSASSAVIYTDAETSTDYLKIVFSGDITFSEDAVLGSNITGPEFGTGASVEKTENDTLLFTLGTGHDVTEASVISFAEDIVKDEEGASFTGDVSITEGAFGTVTVSFADITPSDATVTVNESPEPFVLGYGEHSYSVSAEHYITETDTFTVSADDITAGSKVLEAVELEEEDADITELQSVLDVAKAKQSEDYTETSFAALTLEIATAEGLLTAKYSQQNDVDAEVGALQQAIDDLVGFADVSFSATAVSTDVAATYGKADKIVLVFGEPLGCTADKVLNVLSVKDSVSSAAFADGAQTVLALTLSSEHTLTNSTEITLTQSEDVATAGGSVLKTTSATVSGNIEDVSEQITATSMTATIVKGTEKPGVNAGDKIVLVFNAPVKEKPASIEVSTSESATLSAAADTTFTVYTVSSIDSSVTDATTLTFGTISDIALSGSFGASTAPKAIAAKAEDVTGSALTAGDKIYVLFDRQTNGPVITADQLKAQFGEGASAQWNTSKTQLVITIGTDSAICDGCKINLSSYGIKDEYEISDAIAGDISVSGSFGYTVKPRISKAVAFTQNGMDYIRVFFNIEVEKKSGVGIVESLFDPDFSVGTDATEKLINAGSGLTYYEIKMNKGSHSAFSAGAYKISLTGLVDKETGKYDIDSTPVTISGAFVTPIKPEIIKVVAISQDGSGIAKSGDKLLVIFNTDVKLGTVIAGNGNFGSDYSVKYAQDSKNVVEIQLSGSGIDVIPGTTQITFKNFADYETESETLEDTVVTVDGSFGYVIEPKLISATAYSKDGSGIAKAGDTVEIIFDTKVKDVSVEGNLGEISSENADNPKSGYIFTLKLKENGKIAVGNDLYVWATCEATGIKKTDYKVPLGGSFGKVTVPEILSLTAMSADGSGVVKKGDKITAVFNTSVCVEKITANQKSSDINSEEVFSYTFEIKDSMEDYDIGKTLDYTVTKQGKEYKLSHEIEGSYGFSAMPKAVSAVISQQTDGSAAREVITVIFDRAVKAATDESGKLKLNNAHLGNASMAWESDTVLVITLGDSAVTTEESVLNLSGLGIVEAKSGKTVENLENIQIKGNLIPVVKSVEANSEKNSITVTFTARTNGVADLSGFESVFGTGAYADWTVHNTVLTITLGEDYTITDNGTIVLNGMGIKDAFSGKYDVVGQYKVNGSMSSGTLSVVSAKAQSDFTDLDTAQAGDRIIVSFSGATNLGGKRLGQQLTASELAEIVSANEGAFGENCTAKWTSTSTLTITLGENPTVKVEDEITVKNVAFSNGKGKIAEQQKAISGSFNGRDYVIGNAKLEKISGDCRISATVTNTLLNHSGATPTVVCVAFNSNGGVIGINRAMLKIEDELDVAFEFGGTVSKAKLYVFDRKFATIEDNPDVLAEPAEAVESLEEN